MAQRNLSLLAVLWLAGATLAPAALIAQEGEPYTLDQLAEIVASGVFSEQRILFLVGENCLGFRMDERAERRLREAGARPSLLRSLRDACVELPREVSAVVVTPGEVEIAPGGSRILRARALAADSSEISDISFSWISEDTSVADVSPAGLVMGMAPGEAQIIARSPTGLAGAAIVRVRAPVADSLRAERGGGKSVATAATLGVLVPGGGEFYAGNGVKGAVVLVGAAASLAAGYFIRTEESVGLAIDPDGLPNCDESGASGSCSYQGQIDEDVEETRQLVIGAAVAGAFWLYGLIDGVRSAKRSRTQGSALGGRIADRSLEVLPTNGLRFTSWGGLELVLLRVSE